MEFMLKNLTAALGLVLVVCSQALAQSTIFVVRHAERTDTPMPGAPPPKPSPPGQPADPDLSAAGHERAKSLAFVLRNAEITAIYVTTLKRTQQTAAPLAHVLGLVPTVLAADDTATLVQRLQKHRGSALVVGHSNTVPEVVKGLGVKEPVEVKDSDFDHLFVVVRPAAGEPMLLRLSYR
jgi:phosphohistidine phosphatase SixA